MKVYHGTTLVVKQPSVCFGRDNLDFGKGFYVTTIWEQAARWARTVARLRPLSTAIINIYELDYETILAGDYNLLKFPEYNEEWLDFVVANRMGEHRWSGYDLIEGGIANDRVFDTIENYMAGGIDKQTALGRLRYQFPNNQFCLLSQDLTDCCLHFLESKTLER